jgi:hypothetical protein
MLDNHVQTDTLIRYILPRNETKHWGSLVIYPQNTHFAFQKKSETVFILARKHFVTNSGWMINTGLFALLPFIVVVVIDLMFPGFISGYLAVDSLKQPISIQNIVATIFLFYSFILTYAWTHYISWFHNVYLITNERMIHTSFKLLTGTTTTEAALDRIVDISQESYGFFPSMFNYGNVKVQTATAMKSKFNFEGIPDPSWFRSVLYELVKLINGDNEP